MFFCKECGYESKKWYGRCPSCKEYNTLVDAPGLGKKKKEVDRTQDISSGGAGRKVGISKLKDVNIVNEARITTKIDEFDRVVGGGIVKGSLILLGGNPGIGKSTLTLQIAESLSSANSLLYISGEESTSQIKLRSERLKVKLNDNFLISNNKELEEIFELALKNDIKYLIIDSIQTIYLGSNSGSSGSVSQVKECTLQIMYFAKKYGITVIIIGHVTKEGDIAGPKVLEHMVDTVLYLEGEKNTDYKILRSNKNRFGKVGEIGLFEMSKEGLESVDSVAEFFLDSQIEASGTTIGTILEGERILFVEVQSLLINSDFGYPKRTTQGYDLQRLNLLLGVIQKRLNLSFSTLDCYLNLSSGIKSKEVSLDLAVVMSLISARKNTIVDKKTIFIGEVSLTGEVKKVHRQEERIEQALKLGFTKIYCNESKIKDERIKNCSTINDLI